MAADASELNAAAEAPATQPIPSQPWKNVRVFLPPDTAGPSRLPSLQQEDPRPTPAEIKEAFASHIQQRHGPDAPLMTSAMREREEARLGIKKKEYTECRIRIRFSDRTSVETSVPANAQIPLLYRFLRSQIDPSHAASKTPFVLYQSPPKRDFPERTKDLKLKDKTLKELGMAPQAALNIRWEAAEMNGNTYPAPLHPEAKAHAEPLPSPPVFEGTSLAQSQGQMVSNSGKGAEGDGKKTLPKWLKGLQKK